ncbi:MAG: DUF4956 domain-containing protein [Ruminococcaceae bacterium]|nr:DUF4956 domain-containing protein [Oscillospiraceae bacterium]
MFESIFTIDTVTGNVAHMTNGQLFLVLGCSLLLGLVIAVSYWFGGRASKPLAVSLLVLPVIVQMVIMMVNGNVGAGVAVMGAFNLVRFRSVPGSAREISYIFLAMSIGLATAMGYVALATVIAVGISVVLWLLSKMPVSFGQKQEKMLRIVMPEDLDYIGVFDDIFETYTVSHTIDRVKTTNLGSMFEVSYIVVLKDEKQEKAMIDDIRCRNGNLTIVCSRYNAPNDQL